MKNEPMEVVRMAVTVILFAVYVGMFSLMYFMSHKAYATKGFVDGNYKAIESAAKMFAYFDEETSVSVQEIVGMMTIYGDDYTYIIKAKDGKFLVIYDNDAYPADVNVVNVAKALTAITGTDQSSAYIKCVGGYSEELATINHLMFIDFNLDFDTQMKGTLYSVEIPMYTVGGVRGYNMGTVDKVNVKLDGTYSGNVAYFEAK